MSQVSSSVIKAKVILSMHFSDIFEWFEMFLVIQKACQISLIHIVPR